MYLSLHSILMGLSTFLWVQNMYLYMYLYCRSPRSRKLERISIRYLAKQSLILPHITRQTSYHHCRHTKASHQTLRPSSFPYLCLSSCPCLFSFASFGVSPSSNCLTSSL